MMPRTPPPFEAVAFRCGGCEEKERRKLTLAKDELGVQVALVRFDPDEADPEGHFWDQISAVPLTGDPNLEE